MKEHAPDGSALVGESNYQRVAWHILSLKYTAGRPKRVIDSKRAWRAFRAFLSISWWQTPHVDNKNTREYIPQQQPGQIIVIFSCVSTLGLHSQAFQSVYRLDNSWFHDKKLVEGFRGDVPRAPSMSWKCRMFGRCVGQHYGARPVRCYK